MGSGDVNDTHMKGIDLDALVDASRLDNPILPTRHAEMHLAGIAFVRELRDNVQKAQSSADAVALIARAMELETNMMAAGIAYQHKPGEVAAALGEMRSIRGLSRSVADLEKEIRRQARNASKQIDEREERYNAAVLDKLLGDIAPPGLKCPGGYRIDTDQGVIGPDNNVVCHKPIVILGSSRDVGTGMSRYQLAWLTPRGWVVKHVQRTTVVNHRRIVDLADLEAPVTSINAQLVVRYLAAFEAENMFESTDSAAHMGWVSDRTFLHGDTALGEPLSLAPEDAERQVVKAFSLGGTWVGWCEAIVEDVLPRPLAMVMVYASLASALLYVLRREGFVAEVSGLTSRGKSTSLGAAVSCWGSRAAMGKWTSAGISGYLRKAWLNQSMPLFLDDTKQAKPDVVRSILYVFTSGEGTTRANPDGSLRRTDSWASVLLSTGESPITTFGRDQGARARCICLNGYPYGDDTEENRLASSRTTRRLGENYGHAGRRFVEHLLAIQDQWPALRARHEAIAADLCSKVMNAMSRRLMEHVAVVQLAAEILHHDLGLPGDPALALAALVAAVSDGEPASDLPQLAADDLFSWASANERKFWHRMGNKAPGDEWLGRWEDDRDDGTEWEKIGFVQSIVERKLKEWGYDAEAVMSAWTQRKWRELDGKGGNPNYGPNRARLLVLKRKAFSGA